MMSNNNKLTHWGQLDEVTNREKEIEEALGKEILAKKISTIRENNPNKVNFDFSKEPYFKDEQAKLLIDALRHNLYVKEVNVPNEICDNLKSEINSHTSFSNVIAHNILINLSNERLVRFMQKVDNNINSVREYIENKQNIPPEELDSLVEVYFLIFCVLKEHIINPCFFDAEVEKNEGEEFEFSMDDLFHKPSMNNVISSLEEIRNWLEISDNDFVGLKTIRIEYDQCLELIGLEKNTVLEACDLVKGFRDDFFLKDKTFLLNSLNHSTLEINDSVTDKNLRGVVSISNAPSLARGEPLQRVPVRTNY